MHRADITRGGAALVAAMALLAAGGAAAEDGSGLNLRGSLREGGFKRYVAPLTNPYYNESPYITTEVRPVYAHHAIPGDFITDGGDVDLVAVQARVALTDRFAIIATKDGYADIEFDRALPDEHGFTNIAGGIKYALYSAPEDETILTAGIRYEIPIENLETAKIELQGAGKGFIDVFLSGATLVKGDLGVQASVGGNFALDSDDDVSLLHYSLHVDHEVFDGFYPLVELNGFTPLDDGDRLKGALGKLNLVDFGNLGGEDQGTVVTVGGGFRYKFLDHFQFGFGAETPITDKTDTIFDWRLYVDLVAHL